jgi:hypothetical protein
MELGDETLSILELDACGESHPAIKKENFNGRVYYSTKRPHYTPSPDEIKRQCELIRRTWSESERLRRMFFIVDDRSRTRKPVAIDKD